MSEERVAVEKIAVQNPPETPLRDGVFFGVGAVLLVLALTGFGVAFDLLPLRVDSLRIAVLLLSALFVPLAGLCCLAPSLLRWKTRTVMGLPEAFQQVHSTLSDLESVQREHFRASQTIKSVQHAILEEKSSLQAMQRELHETLLNSRRQEEEMTALRQETARLEAQLQQWRDAAIDYGDVLERGASLEGLAPAYLKALERAAADFARAVQPLGFDIIRPKPGDPFDDRIHQAISEEPFGAEAAADIVPGAVLHSAGWGYRFGTDIVRKAEVVLAKIVMSDE